MNAKSNYYKIDDYLPHLPHLSDYLSENIDLLQFITVFFSLVNRTKFSIAPHHREICNKLNQILNYTHPTNHLIINIAPRHSKTELAVVSLIAYAYALNPACEFMHFSSSEALINRNVINIRKIIESEAYKIAFPNVELTNNAKGSITTTKGGVLYAAPFLGQITGFGCGKFGSETFAGGMIIDDPIKTQDSLSETIREKVNFTWANTLISRKNDQRTPVIVIGQRVHENDFCGFLMQEEGTMEEGGKWDVLKMPAILDEGLDTERALWEKRISLENLNKQKELDKWVFETQYQQNPYPIEGLLFHESTTKYYDELPDEPDYVYCQVDPALSGSDYLCSAIYYIKENKIYIADVIYTKDDTNITIPRIVEQIKQFAPSYANIESNSAFILFTRAIREKVSEAGISTSVRAITNNTNKEVRIFSQAPYILNNFYYSKNGNNEYNLYLKHKHSYLKMVKNQIDDGCDTDAAACEWLRTRGIIPKI